MSEMAKDLKEALIVKAKCLCTSPLHLLKVDGDNSSAGYTSFT